MMKKFLTIFILFFCAFPFILFSPFIVFAFILDWRAGIVSLFIPGIVLLPIVIGSVIGITVAYSHVQEGGRDDFTVIEEHSVFIRHKSGRRMQAREVRIPFSNIQSIETDPDKIERNILDRSKNKMQFLYSTPLPPIGGFYNALAKKENLVSIKLKQHIQIFQITPGFKWFVVKPDAHFVDEIFINISVDRRSDFKKRVESKIGGW